MHPGFQAGQRARPGFAFEKISDVRNQGEANPGEQMMDKSGAFQELKVGQADHDNGFDSKEAGEQEPLRGCGQRDRGFFHWPD